MKPSVPARGVLYTEMMKILVELPSVLLTASSLGSMHTMTTHAQTTTRELINTTESSVATKTDALPVEQPTVYKH